jgi:PilZ domain
MQTVDRQFERYLVKAYAFVHCRGHFQHASLIDYSAGGLRLAGTFGLITTDPVEIEFMSGNRVSARVAWSHGALTGIAFSIPLPATHPELLVLSRRAEHQLHITQLVGRS